MDSLYLQQLLKQKILTTYFKLLPKPQQIEFLPGKPFSANNLRYIFLDGINKQTSPGSAIKRLACSQIPGKGVLTTEN